MNRDVKRTQHFSTDNQLITNLINDIPKDATLIYPVCGATARMQAFPTNENWEYYDIDDTLVPLEHCRDVLIDVPDYRNK